MISSVMSDRCIVIAPSLRHVKALNILLGEMVPSEIVKFEKGDSWDAQPDDKIIYIQIEQPFIAVGRSSFSPAVTAIEEFISVADLYSTAHSFIISDEFSIGLMDTDSYRYGDKILGISSQQRMATLPDHLAQQEG